MPGKECYHCRQWIKDWKTHDCWTTTEEKLTEELSEGLMDAWVRLRETACSFGDQRVYASHKSIMFARKNCYFFVRPKKSVLEVCFFLARALKDPGVRKIQPVSKVKISHLVHIKHRDEVETPFTDWLREAYDASETLRASSKRRKVSASKSAPEKASKKPRNRSRPPSRTKRSR